MQVVQHDLVERLQEVFLEIETSKLLFNQELISQLSERVNRKQSHHDIRMRSNFDEMLTQHLPDFGPHEPDSCHVQIGNKHKSLETELARLNWVLQLNG